MSSSGDEWADWSWFSFIQYPLPLHTPSENVGQEKKTYSSYFLQIWKSRNHCRLHSVRYTSMHKCIQTCYCLPGIHMFLSGLVPSSSAPLGAHRFNSVVLKDTQRDSPPIHSTEIEYSLVTLDMPTTEHVIQLITGQAGCKGLWWERQAQRGEEQGVCAPNVSISPHS